MYLNIYIYIPLYTSLYIYLFIYIFTYLFIKLVSYFFIYIYVIMIHLIYIYTYRPARAFGQDLFSYQADLACSQWSIAPFRSDQSDISYICLICFARLVSLIPRSGELPPLDVGAFLSTTSMSSTQSVTLEQLICSSLVTCTSCIIMHRRQLFSYMHHEYWKFIRYTWRIKAYCFTTSAVEHPGEIWCQHPWTICSLSAPS